MLTARLFFLPKENTSEWGLGPDSVPECPRPRPPPPVIAWMGKILPWGLQSRAPLLTPSRLSLVTERRHTVPVPCPAPCQPPWLCPCKGMESAGSGRGAGAASRSTEPLSSVQEALEAQWLLFKLDSWMAQAVGKGGRALFAQQDSRHMLEETLMERWGRSPCLLSFLLPQILGGWRREVCR